MSFNFDKKMFNTKEQFPVLIEHEKQGSLVERMTEKGFNSYDIHHYMSMYNISGFVISSNNNRKIFSALTSFKNMEDLHIHLNYIKHK